MQIEDKSVAPIKKGECFRKSFIPDEESKGRILKQQKIFDLQQRDIQVGTSFDVLLSIHMSIKMLLCQYACVDLVPFSLGVEACSPNYKSWYAVYANEIS